jgi:hypothetical protein
LNFTAATTETCDALIGVTDQPVPREVSDVSASVLPAGYVNGTLVVNPLPGLSIALANENVRLSWPLWATNYTLQHAIGPLGSSLNWTNVEGSVTTGDGVNSLTLPLGGGASFYRLRLE